MNVNAKLITCHSVDFDLPLTPHFFKHYIELGIDPKNFLLIFNCIKNKNNDSLEQIMEFSKTYGMSPHVWYGEYDSKTMHQKRMKLFDKYCKREDWIIHADADEFHEYPYPLANCLIGNHNAIQGVYIDRITQDGSLSKIEQQPSVFDQFPVKCNAMKIQFVKGGASTGCVKMMAYRYGLETSKGGHEIQNSLIGEIEYVLGYNLAKHSDIRKSSFRHKCPFKVHHFRWSSTILNKLERRKKIYKKIGIKTWKTFSDTIQEIESTDFKLDFSKIDVYT